MGAARSPGALVIRTPLEEMTMSCACVCHVQGIQRIDVGALVTLQAEGRIGLRQLVQGRPYMRMTASLLRDEKPANVNLEKESSEQAKRILQLLEECTTMAEELYPDNMEEIDAMRRAKDWATSTGSRPLLPTGPQGNRVSEWISRISYSGLVEVPGMSSVDMEKLHRLKRLALLSLNTTERLSYTLEHLENTRSSLGAKISLLKLGKSLGQ